MSTLPTIKTPKPSQTNVRIISSSSSTLELWSFSNLTFRGSLASTTPVLSKGLLVLCYASVVLSTWEPCDLLLIFGIISWRRLWERVTSSKPYHRFPDKELHGTYSLDGDHQQHSRRRTMHHHPRGTASNSRHCHRMPHKAKPWSRRAATPKERGA